MPAPDVYGLEKGVRSLFKRSRKVLAKMLIVCSMAAQLFFVVNIATVAQAPVVKKTKYGKKKKFSSKQRMAILKRDLRFSKKRAAIHKRHAKNAQRKAQRHRAASHRARLNYYLKHIRTVTSKLDRYSVKKIMVGEASWYGGGSRNYALSAAMRGFRGKRVKVVNLSNGKTVNIKVNDYGPATWTGRVIDLSRAAFSRVASTRQGVIPRVKLYVY